MKNKLTNLLIAGALALSTVSGAALPVYAATDIGNTQGDTVAGYKSTVVARTDGTVIPNATDCASVAVFNVEKGATVKAYQIVRATYGTHGVTGYEAVVAGSIADLSSPTSAEIEALSKNLASLTNVVDLTENGDHYTANVAAGSWLVIVTGKSDTIYNPMIVAVDYTDANNYSSLGQDTGNGAVDSETHYHIGESFAWAKQFTPTIDKRITNAGSVGNENGDVLGTQVGDTVQFEIETQIPSFSEQYAHPKFWIRDTLSEGLTAPTGSNNDIVVKVNGTALSANEYSLVFDGQTFTVKFGEAYLKSMASVNGDTEVAQRTVVVSYSAKINDKALVNLKDNPNTAQLKYTHTPADASTDNPDVDPPEGPSDKTHQYTFAIVQEIAKVNAADGTAADADGNYVAEVQSPLSGAEFTLTQTADEDGNAVTAGTDGSTHVYTTVEDGLIKFSHLDGGVYTLKETKAPAGYTLNNTEYTITITPVFGEDGVLNEYSVAVSDGVTTNTSVYKAKFDENGNLIENEFDTGSVLAPTAIKDTKLQNLPSTGGQGTIIWTIAGIAIVGGGAIALTLKKKEEKKTA